MNHQTEALLPVSLDEPSPAPSWESNPLGDSRMFPVERHGEIDGGAGSYERLVSRRPVSHVPAWELNAEQAAQVESRSSRSSPPGLPPFHEPKATSELPPNRNTITSWVLEIVAITMSMASIVAIIVVLSRQNGKPIAAWTFAFTLNTVIATLGTIARTSLAFAMSACVGQQKWSWLRRKSDSVQAFQRFDEASRGPWGGTRLFVWLRFRHWAALGALVTVGTVAFDPFLQAVISAYGQMDEINTGSSSTVGQAWRVDGGQIVRSPGSAMIAFNSTAGWLGTIPTTSRPDFGIISSIYGGFYNNSVLPENTVAFECTTGNCTWPTFVSAAVCSSCVDVSSDVSIEQGSGEYNGTNVPQGINQGGRNKDFSIAALPYSEIRNWNGYSKIANENWWNLTTGNSQGLSRTLMTLNTTYKSSRTLRHGNIDTLMMAFAIMRAPDEWIQSKVPWQSSRPIATECALYFCTNAYQARSQNGVLEERVVGSWAIRDQESFAVDPSGSVQPEPGVEAVPGAPWVDVDIDDLYDPIETADLSRYDLRLKIGPDPIEGFALPDAIAQGVNISDALVRSTIKYLHEFTGRTDDDINMAVKFGNESYVRPIAYPNSDAPPVIDALWSSTNLTATFENVARSLTSQIRNTSPQRHEGSTQSWVMHVRVDWAYLAYPISMLLIGILYVILIIVESARLEIPVWKEEALPTLLYGFNDEGQVLLRKRETYEGGKKVVTNVRYDLDEKEDCLRLVAK